MREIKFRAWDKHKKEIVKDEWFYSIKLDGRVGYHSNCGEIEFEEDNTIILMQYTGLKDKNGKEICEGDIIENDDWGLSSPEDAVRAKIIFKLDDIFSGFYCEELLDGELFPNGNLASWQTEKIEVIGNIYQNPNLLEGKQCLT